MEIINLTPKSTKTFSSLILYSYFTFKDNLYCKTDDHWAINLNGMDCYAISVKFVGNEQTTPISIVKIEYKE